MPVQASNRLFKLLNRTDRLEVYRLEVNPHATGWRSIVWTGCYGPYPTRSVADYTTEIFVLVLSVSRTAKYLLATGTPEEISPPEERRTFRTDSSHSLTCCIIKASRGLAAQQGQVPKGCVIIYSNITTYDG
jgi:hypothetical protein